jgi:hypothetical protein
MREFLVGALRESISARLRELPRIPREISSEWCLLFTINSQRAAAYSDSPRKVSETQYTQPE